jgi:hypothetical protein
MVELKLSACWAKGASLVYVRYLKQVTWAALYFLQAELVSDPATAKLAAFSETFPLALPSGCNSDKAHEVTVGVSRAAGSKCARCWNYSELVGSESVSDLCERCIPVIDELGFQGPASSGPVSAKIEEALASAQ